MLDDEHLLEISPRLRLGPLIARGAFGKVYRGRQLAVARDVAVKVLHEELALDTEPGRLFRDEIRAIGTIDHRNVVRIYDADESPDGRLFFVMELLEGPTLQTLADAGPLPLQRARSLVAQLLDGLAAVHAVGRIHADIKPSNAMVVGSGVDERVVLIDFGLSRVNVADRPAEAVGGTRVYMAPEQLSDWKVDARSDVYAAALVFVKLATGWQRSEGDTIPSLAAIEDPSLRSALADALSRDPAKRPSARELAHALRGHARSELIETPFRELAPLTELDRDRLYGRDDDLRRLLRRIEDGGPVVLTAASGVGKTSLLRAGLAERLSRRGLRYVYVACRARTSDLLAESIAPGAQSLDGALAELDERLVLVLDQVEAMLAVGGDGDQVLEQLVRAAITARCSLVLGVREDMLARLLDTSPRLADGVPQVRLSPLTRAGASAAFVEPLREFGVQVSSDLLAKLLGDLEQSGRHLELGNTAAPIYPPHLQLAGAALFESLASGETQLELGHYERLGGFEAIVGDHLDRTLDQLSDSDRELARSLFLALITGPQSRAIRTEPELLADIGPNHDDQDLSRVLTRLAAKRLVARTHGADGVASWHLIHDTLVARIEAWVTVFDLDRRRLAELLRFHLRQSTDDHPALLSARQIRELEAIPGLIDEIEAEWKPRGTVWNARALVARSKQLLRYRRGLFIGAGILVSALTIFLVVRWSHERSLRAAENRLRDLNIGRIDLELQPFDLRFDTSTGATQKVPVPGGNLADLSWDFYQPDEADPQSPGARIDADHLTRGTRTNISERGVQIRGGDAFLVITGRGRPGEHCGRSVIPLRHLPGNDHFASARLLKVLVPTCQASKFDTVEVPAGPFIYSGVGTPPTQWPASALPPKARVQLPWFAIDRTEITNAAYAIFDELVDIHEISAPGYASALSDGAGPNFPRGSLDWFDARAFCRFLGKDLPTTKEWQKAVRGGEMIAGQPNPWPERNLPWGMGTGRAHVADDNSGGEFGRANDPRHPVAVATNPTDRSPYGVYDLAGNVQEWTLDTEWNAEHQPIRRRIRVTRGGNWFDTTPQTLNDYMAIENPRIPTARFAYLGARCVVRDE